jgi:HSP20 family molecular chaperone IbpA
MTKHQGQAPSRAEHAEDTPVFVPRVDIRETEAAVLLVADMPGVDETSVNIDLEGSELTIKGGYLPKAPEGYTATYREYRSGNYERTFTLGDTIDRDGIKATVSNGVLRLTLPKAKEAQPKRIAVKAG